MSGEQLCLDLALACACGRDLLSTVERRRSRCDRCILGQSIALLPRMTIVHTDRSWVSLGGGAPVELGEAWPEVDR